MNGVYAFLAPILLLLSVISFVIHFRNERKKTLIERPFHAAKDSGKESSIAGVTVQSGGQVVQPYCEQSKLCRFCPMRK